MTPGQLADAAWTKINRAGGDLGGMVVKRKLVRVGLVKVIERLEDALANLREAIGERR